MPLYKFRCPDCATLFEEKRSFARSDDPALCPTCGGRQTAKVFASAMFYTPGMAARGMLEPKTAFKNVPAGHSAGCPCCGGQ